MHKPVRYYITESNDQPVVRSVQIATRSESPAELAPQAEFDAAATTESRLSRLSSSTKRLIPHRTDPLRR